MHLNTIKSTARLLILAAVSIFFLLIYSTTTSPLTEYYGQDSAFFTLVGYGMTKGLLPYRDFFDMKGPYLFLFEYIGQLIYPGRTGSFIIQCINLTLCLWIIDKIYHRKNTATTYCWSKTLLVYTTPCLFVFGYTIEGGNLTEEFSLPILLGALFFVMKYFEKLEEDPESEHPLMYGLYYGIAFGVQALIRITNAAFIGAILATISFDLIVRKKYKNLLLNALVFILGCGIAFAPMCVYYSQKGLLEQMLSQVFLFGVQYSLEYSFISKACSFFIDKYRMLIAMTFPMVVLGLYGERNWKYWFLTILSYLLLVLACVMGNGYTHYLTLGIPHLVLGFVLLKKLRANKPTTKIIASVLVLLFLIAGISVYSSTRRCLKTIINQTYTESRQNALQIKDAIGENQGDVYAYGLPSCSNWYLQAELLPCNRYCDWQEHYILLNPKIGEEILQWLVEDSPEWIVLATDKSIEYPAIANIIETRYSIHTQNKEYTLYKHVN